MAPIGCPSLAQVARIDGQSARERAPQRLVGGDERLQALVDLAIRAFAPLLCWR